MHRAVLKDGQQVVVKVQHATVSKRLLQDLENLQVRVTASVRPHTPVAEGLVH